MNIYGIEKIWLYLHDNPKVVNPNMFVTNTYQYTSKLVEMLTLNPEYIGELNLRMLTERINDSDFFLKARNGYGKTEYRLVKMMRIKGLGDILKRLFPELVPDEKPENKLNY